MKNLEITSNPEVQIVFDNYPETVKEKMIMLRELILETAKEIDAINSIDWKTKTPNQYAMYFKCTSRLVETFKTTFLTTFQFEGNRAIIFQLNENIPIKELKICIKATLTYLQVKHLPTLGI